MRQITSHLSIGKKYGKYLVLSIIGKNENRACRVLCQCDCGNTRETTLSNLKNGHAKSCGCSKNITHGLTGNPIYNLWAGMKTRCISPKANNYKDYGGRGIKVCDEWLNNLTGFIQWAKNNGYKEGLEIDRMDNNGDYSPENCRFVTRKVNSRNRRSNVVYEYNGERKILIEWIETLGLKYNLIYDRLYRGWDFKRAVETPINYLKNTAA